MSSPLEVLRSRYCLAYLSHCIHFYSIKKFMRPNKTVIMKDVTFKFKSQSSKGMYLYSGRSREQTPSGRKKVPITRANTEFVWELRKTPGILQRHSQVELSAHESVRQENFNCINCSHCILIPYNSISTSTHYVVVTNCYCMSFRCLLK